MFLVTVTTYNTRSDLLKKAGTGSGHRGSTGVAYAASTDAGVSSAA